MAIIKKIYKQRNPGEDVEKREPTVVGIVSWYIYYPTVGRNVNWYSYYGEQYGDPLENWE